MNFKIIVFSERYFFRGKISIQYTGQEREVQDWREEYRTGERRTGMERGVQDKGEEYRTGLYDWTIRDMDSHSRGVGIRNIGLVQQEQD